MSYPSDSIKPMKAFVSLILYVVLLLATPAAETIPASKVTAEQMEQLLTSMVSQAEAQKVIRSQFQHLAIPNFKETEIEEAQKQLIKYSQDRLKVRS